MDDKECFLTFGYRRGFITTCWNRAKKVEEFSVLRYEGDRAFRVKSLHAAKLRIGKYEGGRA